MPENLYLLTRSASVINRFRRASPPDLRIMPVACLAEVRHDLNEARVIIDPRALGPCCAATLEVRSRTGLRRNITFLGQPVPSLTAHTLPGSVPPCVESDCRGATVSRALAEPPTSAAWRRRDYIFEKPPIESRQRRFLDLARRHRHEAYREAEAAADLRCCVRHLTRLTLRWFDYSPRVVIGIFRIESVARGLRVTVRSLKDLARAHGYSSRQAMNRHFHSFTGVHPASYREVHPHLQATQEDLSMSEYGPSPGAPNRSI